MMVRAFAALMLGAVLACAPAAARQAPAANAAAPAVTAPAALPPAARAPLPRQAPPPVQPMAATSAGSLLQTIFGLTVVLAMLALFAWAMKRFGPRQSTGAAGLRIVSALNLGGRERIIVVEVGDQWIVVGASPGRVNALATMPRQHAEPGPATLHPHAPAASSFSEWLKQTIDKRNAK
ncbi:MAG: flagellar biosynthetic protein FliO [Telluria sp.]